ncbi:5-formyltetrahydrofolate cyclo-ligase [Nitrococcus mobilis]|uniref:5-formyltetrahydrofolate cyclo-ligase n=1 Tax=Nitrococcus mobilis Nb-231 TaxID=314278 RepID=A4BS87_9GAMM|nr:5-formyltetrahydrofolate cyclo-ligase [Nitrococcus mobilis]EAR21347.1 5-formyltetrahydrofolate cyclo-ligase [Nitrococcus mobilis Nb-231]
MESKAELRHRMRRQRRQLGLCERTRAARQLTAVLRRSRWYHHSHRIACYWAMDGEMDLGAFLQRAHQDGRVIYLPVLQKKPTKSLRFYQYRPGERLRANRFGIPEPRPRQANRIACRDLDLVLVPLVAFDQQGHRLGMGAGFYDHTFAFLRHQRGRWRRPRLLGIAFSFQRIVELPVEPWDVPLAGVATERGLTRCQIENRSCSSNPNRS